MTLGLAEMYVGTMHGYCLDLLQRLVPETFKFSVLTDDHGAAVRRPVQPQVRADDVPDSQVVRRLCAAFLHSKLYLQVTSVLREDEVD